jgi:thioredoxin 1
MTWIGKLLGITPQQKPLSVTDATFEQEVLHSELPVLLDVWGPSCGPCKQLEPIIMDLAAQYRGKVKVCELSAASNPLSVGRLQVRATPTVIYYKDGQELERLHGFRSSLFHRQTIQELFGIEG